MAEPPLTVLQLTASGDTAGATRSIVELSLALAARGHRVLLGARPESHIYERLGKAGIPVEPIAFRRKMSLRDARRVADVARAHGVDVVNAHASKDRYAAIVARALFSMQARVVITRRVMPSSSGGAIQGWLYSRGTDRIVAVSDAVKAALVRLGTPAEHVTTIRNGLSPERVGRVRPPRSEALLAELGIPADVPIVGIVSRLKDQADVLRALPLLARPLAVLFVGIKRPAAFEPLEAQLSPGQHVRYIPFAWDVLPYYGLLDLSVLPSRIEGLSQTLLESMALAIPVIASRAGGNTDVIRDGQNGLLYGPGDAPDLARQLARLLDDAELRERLRAAGRVTATEELSLERTVTATEALYRELVAQGRAARQTAPAAAL